VLVLVAGWLATATPPASAATDYASQLVEGDIATRDANDRIYQLEASRTYDPRPDLDRIRTTRETPGHGTHSWANFWRQELIDLLARTEREDDTGKDSGGRARR
jgi:homoserine O-acetyltransferase